MIDLLVLGHGAARTQELAAIFENAGYEVVGIDDLISCEQKWAAGQDSSKGVAIVDAMEMDDQRMEKIPPSVLTYFLNWTKRSVMGWHLSMRHRSLIAPNGQSFELTTLEFTFIKLFALVEKGEAVSRKQIVLSFGEDYLSYDQNRIDTLVRRLRQKTEACSGLRLPLNTERVRGFSFGDTLIIDQ